MNTIQIVLRLIFLISILCVTALWVYNSYAQVVTRLPQQNCIYAK